MRESLPPIPITLRWTFGVGSSAALAEINRFPEWMQNLVYWGALLVLLFSFISLFVHYARWLAPKIRLPNLLTRAFPEPVKRDKKMSEAISYVVTDSGATRFYK